MSRGHDSRGHDSTAGPSPAVSYTLPGTSGALWLGLGPAALGALGVSLLATVLLMLRGAPIWLSLLVAALGAATGAWPIAGRSTLQWLPLAARHAARRLAGHRTWTTGVASPGAATDQTVTGAGQRSRPRNLPLPPAWGRLQVTGADADVGAGLILNRARGRATVLLEVTGPGYFGLLDPAAQDSELGRWGTSLTTLLTLPGVHHLHWLTHTRPQPQPAVDRKPVGGLASDYADLVRHIHSVASAHTHLLAVTVSAEDPGLIRNLVRQASSALLAADLLCCPVGSSELPRLLRLLLDPTLPDDLEPAGATRYRVAEAAVLSMRTGWSSCQTDDTHHRAYAITGWPRVSLPADWLAPLLHQPPGPGTARTLAVHACPVGAQHASRRARASAARSRLDAADRQRLGFTPAAGNALDELDAQNTESELLAGYRMADVSALVILHAPDLAALDHSARDLTALTVSQRIDLRPLHGQHDQALAAALPLGQLPGARR